MKDKAGAIKDLKCPLCDSPLERDDYRLAIRNMEKQAKIRAEEKLATESESHQNRLAEIEKAHKREMEEYIEERKNALVEQRKGFLATQQQLMDEVKRDRDAQLQNAKKEKASEISRAKKESDSLIQKLRTEIRQSAKTREKQMAKLEKEMKQDHQRVVASKDKKISTLKKEISMQYSGDLKIKNKEIAQLRKDLNNAKTTAKNMARLDMEAQIEQQKRTYENRLDEQASEIKEKDLMLERAKQELDTVKGKLQQKQPELQGEVGERDLLRLLEEAFPRDRFERQRRGTASSDLIQHVQLPSGRLGMPIVYDNKAGGRYSKADIQKAAAYKRTHSTEYSLIVSSKPQKAVRNGLLGEVDGVIVVHPSIVVEVAKTIREGILKIERVSVSQNDKDAKQARLYKYVVGHEFAEVMRSLESADKEMDELQSSEEKNHKTLWDRRKSVVAKQRKAHIDLSGGIDAIIQSGVLEEPAHVV